MLLFDSLRACVFGSPRLKALTALGLLIASIAPAAAQSTAGWLRYAVPPDPPRYHGLPHAVVLLGNAAGVIAPEEQTAADELDRGLGHMVAGTDVVSHRFDLRQDAIILGTTDALHRAHLSRHLRGWTEKPLPEEGFRIVHLRRGIREWYVLQGGSPRAELWAAFRFAALVAEDQQLPQELIETPHLALRALDMGPGAALLPLLETPPPGSTPEGLSVRSSIARLLASVGLNTVIADADAEEAARLTQLLRPYGVRLQPRLPATADQLPTISSDLALRLPDRVTPGELRAAIDRSNTLARRLRIAGGTVLLEGALGSPLLGPSLASATPGATQDQRVAELRGGLEPNVVLATDALLPEYPLLPLASPSFGLLPAVPQAAVLQVLPVRADMLAYPAPAWAALLQTPEHGPHGDTTLADLLAGSRPNVVHGGVIGTLSATDAVHLLQQPLLHANLYAFGRLAWSPGLSPEAITEEWARQTWGDDARVYATATHLLLQSASAAQDVAAPLGMPWLTDTAGNPAPAVAARLRTAATPLADASAIGTDRTDTGTREAELYPAAFATVLQDPARCPPSVLLLFHRLPWRYALPDGKALAQHLYDTVFAGAAAAGNAVDAWETTHSLVDEPRYATVHTFLLSAATHTDITRDVTTEWLQSTGGVRDTLGFVGSHPGRANASALRRSGFAPLGSRGAAQTSVATTDDSTAPCRETCTATLPFSREANVYRVTVAYRQGDGRTAFSLLVNGERRAAWNVSSEEERTEHAPAAMERFVVNGVHLQPGDTVAVSMHVEPRAAASLDFVEITRDPRWN